VRLSLSLAIGAVAVGLSFWGTLKTIDYLKQPSDQVTPSADLGIAIFEEGKAIASDLTITRNGVPGPEGARVILLEDNSPKYGLVYEDVPATPGMTSTFSVDLKPGTSQLVQLVMTYFGGTPQTYHVLWDTREMKAIASEGDVSNADIGKGWWRVKLSGANGNSGNTSLRLIVYPRHGKAEDTGNLYIANPRLILAHPR
jgi:hypothetical protein